MKKKFTVSITIAAATIFALTTISSPALAKKSSSPNTACTCKDHEHCKKSKKACKDDKTCQCTHTDEKTN